MKRFQSAFAVPSGFAFSAQTSGRAAAKDRDEAIAGRLLGEPKSGEARRSHPSFTRDRAA